ncbi:MAG: AAA family ATPase [Chlamydiia bacterium]|nr:AAA family ATPase [Chlamydiia bacterium]
MITVFGGIKGGSGKTTLSTNLCVVQAFSGKKVLLVDADEQQSARDWSEHRESLEIDTPWTTISLFGASLRTQVLKLKSHYDEIIVDVGGRDTTSQRAALTIADILIVPFQPRSLDVWTLGKLSSLLDEVCVINPELKTYAVINRADFQGKDNREAFEIINETGNIFCLDEMIYQRKVFANASAEGKGVIETNPQDKKAVSEIQNLSNRIFRNDTILTSK